VLRKYCAQSGRILSNTVRKENEDAPQAKYLKSLSIPPRPATYRPVPPSPTPRAHPHTTVDVHGGWDWRDVAGYGGISRDESQNQ
jgi:hypothetical protein